MQMTVETEITHKYLMNKTKSELAYFILTLIKDAELVRDAQQRIGADGVVAHTCDYEDCKNPAVIHYCEEHDQ